MEDQKKKKVLSEANVQAGATSLDIDVLSLKYSEMQDAMQMMNDEFSECVKQAEEKNDTGFVIKGNRRKLESEQMHKELSVLKDQISDLHEKQKKLCP